MRKSPRRMKCTFHPMGVICTSKSKCEVCGWNPDVEAFRKFKMEARRREETGDTGAATGAE